MKLIAAQTLSQAWLEGCQHLLAQTAWLDTAVILHVENPTRVRRQDRVVAETLDEFLVAHDRFSNHTVAETIFPGYEYKRHGVDGVFNVYPNEIYPKIKRHPDIRWGTYAHRLVRRSDGSGNEYNPLEICINKMRQKQPVRAAYEVGLGFGFDLALYDDDDDRTARLGGPCLSHLSFKLIGKKVSLTALYRSHFYIQKAYGNLLGLARLQSFVAEQVGVEVGPLVCHSTMAWLENGKDWGWAKKEVAPLMATCAALLDEGSARDPKIIAKEGPHDATRTDSRTTA